MHIPVLITERLSIRPYVMDDAEQINQILNAAFGGQSTLAARREWLEWTILSYKMLALLDQPPYGDRAIVLNSSQELIGSIGLVPSYGPFDKLPYFSQASKVEAGQFSSPAIGLFWGLAPEHQGQGYATEAARALINYMFGNYGLKRIVATTEYENAASIAVMERLGMVIERNPDQDPPWFQIVGILENPKLHK